MNEQQRKNTLIIKSVLEKKIAENFNPGHLNNWESSCGTHRCVGGDVFMLMYPGETITPLYHCSNFHAETEDFQKFRCNFRELFGFSQEFSIVLSGEEGDVFGIEDEGTLRERLYYVNEQLGEEL